MKQVIITKIELRQEKRQLIEMNIDDNRPIDFSEKDILPYLDDSRKFLNFYFLEIKIKNG